MKIRLERDVLAEAVQWAARSLPLRPSVPILAGLLVRADADGVISPRDNVVSIRSAYVVRRPSGLHLAR